MDLFIEIFSDLLPLVGFCIGVVVLGIATKKDTQQ